MRPRRVLVIAPYGIGDLLFATPVLRALRLLPTIERVDLLLGSRTGSVLQNNPHVDEVMILNRSELTGKSPWHQISFFFKFFHKLRSKKYDLLLDYSMRDEFSFFCKWILGIPARAGFRFKKRGVFLTHPVRIPEGFNKKHVVDYFAAVAEKAGVPVRDRYMEFYLSEEEKSAVARKLGRGPAPYLVISPGGGESWGKDAHFKRWPVQYWAEFLNKLSKQIPFEQILIVGSAGEKELARELAGKLFIPARNFCGELTLGETAAFIERAAVFAGNDGGLVHVAHALHVPVIAFYGPVDPAVYGPYPLHPLAVAVYKKELACRPCYHRFRYNAACAGRECLQDLKPEEALKTLHEADFFREFILPRCGA